MPTFEEILERAKSLGLPMAEYQFEKTSRSSVPDPPFLIYMSEEEQYGSDFKAFLRRIDGTLELYTDRKPDPDLEKRVEEEALYDIDCTKAQIKINSENMVQTTYEFEIIQKKGK